MMERDGQNLSLWQATVAAYKTKNTAVMNTLYDVIIVSGGITNRYQHGVIVAAIG